VGFTTAADAVLMGVVSAPVAAAGVLLEPAEFATVMVVGIPPLAVDDTEDPMDKDAAVIPVVCEASDDCGAVLLDNCALEYRSFDVLATVVTTTAGACDDDVLLSRLVAKAFPQLGCPFASLEHRSPGWQQKTSFGQRTYPGSAQVLPELVHCSPIGQQPSMPSTVTHV